MEIPQQKLPIVFSQMLQMFPNIPHDIVWMYVQRYPNDTAKCAQMLNLQCGKYTDFQTSSSPMNNSMNCNELQIPLSMKPAKITYNFNSDSSMTEQVLPLPNSAANDINENVFNHATENEQLISNVTGANFNSESAHHVIDKNSTPNFSMNINTSGNYQKPLTLTIDMDDEDEDDSLHSWRPKFSNGSLSSDFFMPSPTVENFQFSGNQISDFAFEHNLSGIEMNQEHVQSALNNYLPLSGNTFGMNVIANHLHFQKLQINAIRYNVIKTKIELGDLKESVEKLAFELGEKMQSKSVEDIEKLNEEIVQLRLECQCLCTEVDFCKQDQDLLGEVNENCYKKENPLQYNAGSCQSSCNQRGYYPQNQNFDVPEESKWQCAKCTFENHPAIRVCEMCHLPRPCARRLPHMIPPADECFCHPKKETCPIQS